MESAEYVAEAPPLVAGKVHGVRSWRLLDGGDGGAVLLGSMSSGSYWPPGRPLTARCDATPELRSHSVPKGGCSCGIYAWHPFQAVDSMAIAPGPLWVEGSLPLDFVTGVVEGWGRIEVHAAGFRAEHAQPAILFAEAGAPNEHLSMIERLAKSYGAAMVEVRTGEELAAQIEALPHGLDPCWLDGLLASEVDVTLKRQADGYLSGRKKLALGGSGYVVEGHEPPDRWLPELDVDLPGVTVARVAGAAFRPHALQDRSFDPGRAAASSSRAPQLTRLERNRDLGRATPPARRVRPRGARTERGADAP